MIKRIFRRKRPRITSSGIANPTVKIPAASKLRLGDGIQTKTYIPKDYQDGANGFIWWVETNVIVSIEINKVHEEYYMGDLPTTINPETKRPYNHLWEEQKEVVREALQMYDGVFYYTLIVLCWMRGEGKSFLVCLIQLWKFFCFERQMIMLGANNKDQSKFVHFSIMQGIVLKSPKLLEQVGGRKNVQEKEIRIRDAKGEITSFIRPMSTSTGIVSNITGYTFSEIFDMKNPSFFEQLDGSIRNITNALGTIDSTVSSKQHLLYSKLYLGWLNKVLKSCFFSHRQSKNADYRDYWHPNMTQRQLSDYAAKFSMGGFAQYFKNTWESGRHQVFSMPLIYGMRYFGTDGRIGNNDALIAKMTRVADLKEDLKDINGLVAVKEASLEDRMAVISQITNDANEEIGDIESTCRSIDSLYTLSGTTPAIPDAKVLQRLTDIYKTNWALGVGIDFGDSLAVEQKANTIVTLILKGLPNSLVDPKLLTEEAGQRVQYMYFLLHIAKIDNHDLDVVKVLIDEYSDIFDGVDAIGLEKYRAWDLKNWCEEREISLLAVHPGYLKQHEMFQTLYNALDAGHFKAPSVGIHGAKGPDILIEEFETFDHDTFKKWFGSPMKFEKNGIQDDSVYGSGWGIAGMQNLQAIHFRPRFSKSFELMYLPPE